jgi:ABC-type phosphate transport system substrate-binding protein
MNSIGGVIMQKNFATFTSIFVVLLIGFSCVAKAQVVLIVNSDVKAGDVSSADVREVFTGNSSTFKDGSHVTPVLLKSGAISDGFLALYIGKSDSAFRANWRSLLFSGQVVMPRTLNSEAAVVDFVAHTPGAIGYIAKSTPHDGVKTLSVR